MNTVGRSFPVEWPLAGSKRQCITDCEAIAYKSKQRKTGLNEKAKDDRDKQDNRPTKVVQDTTIATIEPAMSTADCSIFKSLNEEEAIQLAVEVDKVNKNNIIAARQTAKRIKQDEKELEKKKESLKSLQSLLGDLRRNISYPDEEVAKNLETLDEVSSKFGVRNILNCLGLFDEYITELQKELS